MKEEAARFTQIQLSDATLKFRLYLSKITQEQNSTSNLEKICHLATQHFLKFVQSQEFVRQNYDILKSLVYQKKNYYIMYIIDTLLKNNRQIMILAKKDLEGLFKQIWGRIIHEPKNQYKVQGLKSMVRTWGVIYSKKTGMEESIRKWLSQKYDANLNLPNRSKALFEQTYQKNKNQNDSKLTALLTELNQEEPAKKQSNSFMDLKHKIFQD